MKLYEIVTALRNAKGSKEKQSILDGQKDNELFKAFCKAVYDPAISYYVTKIPKVAASDMAEFDGDLIAWIVDNIAGRVYTGDRALAHLKQMSACLNVEGQELMQIILDRKIGASVGDTMILKTWPDLYFLPPYMRCSSMDAKVRAHYATLVHFYVQPKYDGSFCYLSTKMGATRQGSLYPTWLINRLSNGLMPDMVLMGEMEVLMFNGDFYAPMARKDGNGVLNSVLQGGEEKDFEQYQFKYTAWDAVPYDDFKAGISEDIYEDRLDFLARATIKTSAITIGFTWTVDSVKKANEIHIKETKAGREGTVWKNPKGLWKDSSSGTKDAVKNKVVFSCEMEVEDYYEGVGKAAGMLGGVRMKSRCGKVKNDCGSGFSDKQRKDFWAIKEQLPGKIFEVEANDITEARGKSTFSLSLPIFVEERFDKKEADTYERIVEQFEAVKNGLTN